MSSLVAKRIIPWFVAALVVLLADWAICFASIQRLERNRDRADQSRRFIERIERILSLAKDAETGHRGYVITGGEEYLAPYRSAAAELRVQLPELLRTPVESRPVLDRFGKLIEEKMKFLSEEIELRRQQGFDAARAIVVSNRGKEIMDEARRAAAELQQGEEQRLAQQSEQSLRSSEDVYITTGIAALLNLTFLGVIYWRVNADLVVRHRAAEQVRTSEERLRAIIDNSDAVVFMKDLHGCYLLVNSAFERLFAIAREEAEGKTDAELFPPKIARVLACHDREVVASGVPQHEEELASAEMIPGLNQPRTFLTVRFPVRDGDRDGEIYAIGGISTEITRRKLAEEDLLRRTDELKTLAESLEQRVETRTAELRQANKELEAFTYTVSHDLRAPLRGIQGFAEALVEDYGPQLAAEGQDYLRRVVAAVARMERLIEDLLEYSRLSRTELQLAPVFLPAVVREAMIQVQGDITASGATVEVQEQMPSVLAHHRILVQIVQNLLTNALKFSQPGQPPRVRIYAEKQGPMVKLWIEDEGIGIEPAHFARIFQIFERLHGQEMYAGTGIGLAIVKKGVERMGGSCGVESAVAKGSRFWIGLQSTPPPP